MAEEQRPGELHQRWEALRQDLDDEWRRLEHERQDLETMRLELDQERARLAAKEKLLSMSPEQRADLEELFDLIRITTGARC